MMMGSNTSVGFVDSMEYFFLSPHTIHQLVRMVQQGLAMIGQADFPVGRLL